MFGGFNVILMIFKALEAPSALQRFILPPAVALMPLTFIGPWTRDPLFRQRQKPFIGPCIFSASARDPLLDHGPEGQIAIKQL
jgi:hypothetical protein